MSIFDMKVIMIVIYRV